MAGKGEKASELRGEEGSSIQSVQRAARILGLFTVSNPRLTLTQITALALLTKPTAHRYTVALREANLLRYDGAAGVYTLGPQVLRLGAAARAGLPVVTVAGPVMQRLMHQVNETVVLSIWDGEAPVVVRIEDNVDRVVRVSVAVGARLSPTASAQGRVFCTFLPEGEIPWLKARLRASADLRLTLGETRASGIALNSPTAYGVSSIAVPVFGDGHVIAALALVGTLTAIPANRTSQLARDLADAGRQLSDELGSHGARRSTDGAARVMAPAQRPPGTVAARASAPRHPRRSAG